MVMAWLERFLKHRNRDLHIAITAWCMAALGAWLLPGMFEFKWTPNECNAISALRTISSSQELYNTRYGSYGTLQGLCNKKLIDSVLADADIVTGSSKSGYRYAMIVNGSSSWCCVASRLDPPASRQHHSAPGDSDLERIRGREQLPLSRSQASRDGRPLRRTRQHPAEGRTVSTLRRCRFILGHGDQPGQPSGRRARDRGSTSGT